MQKTILFIGLCVLQIIGFSSAMATADGVVRVPLPTDKPARNLYPVGAINFIYAYPHPDHQAGRFIETFKTALVKTDWGYGTTDDIGRAPQSVSIDDIELRGRIYLSAAALQAILQSGVKYYTDQGYMGVYLMPHPEDISPYGQDLRAPHNDVLRLLVKTSTVSAVKTRARGPRFLNQELLAKQHHQWIADHSPVQPSRTEKAYNDLLLRPPIDNYLARLNRHPGRHVGMTVGGTDSEGTAALEYRITESKPWVSYLQFANTGTGNTARWQKRAGYVHNQITGHDDILSLDYTTAGFDDYNAAQFKYDAPWLWDQASNLRIGTNGSFSEFTSTDVGLQGADFKGKTYSLGLNLAYLAYQHKDWFVDITGRLDYKRIQVDNRLAQVKGDQKLLKPRLGLVLERTNRITNTKASLDFETNLAGFAGTDSATLGNLGRSHADARWTVARASVAHSFFLEPLIYGAAFRDPSTPESSTMAHEIRLNARAQYVFGDDRLIPQEKLVAGGLYSVRGYPQSSVSGDSGFVGSAEYRLHLPRLLPFNPNPQTQLFGDVFRMTPTQVYGYPDWDLVLKLFSDVGYTVNNDNITGLETNESLWSIGGGLELQVRKNLRLQLDYGHSLLDLQNSRVEKGNSEIHFEATLFY